MQVGGEDQRYPEHGQEVAEDDALLTLRRIDRGDEAEAELLGDDRACDLERGDGEPRGHSEHGADEQLLAKHHQHRPVGPQIEVIGIAMERQQHGRERQGDRQAHAHRHAHLAQPGQQHQHGADAREHEHEGRRQRREEGDVDLHDEAGE